MTAKKKRNYIYDIIFVALMGLLAWKLINNRPQKDIENTEDQSALNEFEAKKNYNLDYYVLRSAGNIEIKTIPLTYLINKEGEVTKVVNRSKNWASASSFEQLNKLLK